MIGDYLYKMARKSLDPGLYHRFSGSLLGRGRHWDRVENYSGMFEFYRSGGLEFRDKTVVEIGSGHQFFTALFFLSAGAAKVILVDPKLTAGREKLKAAVKAFKTVAGAGDIPEDFHDRIDCYRDLSEVPSAWNGRVEFLGSYLVLEHFSDIQSFFLNTRRLIHPEGVSRNRVDLSDHTYHILGKYRLTRGLADRRSLYHLRYSDAAFGRVNDSKCYMNRKLLPEYLEAADRFGLQVLHLSKRIDPGAVVHLDLASRFRNSDPDDLKVVDFNLDLSLRPDAPGI